MSKLRQLKWDKIKVEEAQGFVFEYNQAYWLGIRQLCPYIFHKFTAICVTTKATYEDAKKKLTLEDWMYWVVYNFVKTGNNYKYRIKPPDELIILLKIATATATNKFFFLSEVCDV